MRTLSSLIWLIGTLHCRQQRTTEVHLHTDDTPSCERALNFAKIDAINFPRHKLKTKTIDETMSSSSSNGVFATRKHNEKLRLVRRSCILQFSKYLCTRDYVFIYSWQRPLWERSERHSAACDTAISSELKETVAHPPSSASDGVLDRDMRDKGQKQIKKSRINIISILMKNDIVACHHPFVMRSFKTCVPLSSRHEHKDTAAPI